MSPGSKAPDTEEELAVFRDNLLSDPFARRLLLSEDRSVLAVIFSTGRMSDHDRFVASLDAILDDLEDHFAVHSTSIVQSTFMTKKYLLRDFPRLLVFTSLFILVIYYLGFRAKRAVLLPALVVGFGTIWCLGFMGLVRYPISVVSITTPPLVLILGSSYTIHMLNQYYREMRGDPENRMWIVSAVSHVNKTILMAALTTVIGFGSLLATNMSQSREFGLSTSVGIIACALLSLFFLPATLSLLRTPSADQRRRVMEGSLSRIMGRLSAFVLRWRAALIVVFVVTAVAFGLLVGELRHLSEYINYFPARDELVKDTNFITEKLGGYQQINLTMTAPGERRNYFLDPDVLQRISEFERRLGRREDVYQVISFVTYLKHLNELMTGQEEIPETRGLILLLSRYLKIMSAEAHTDSILSTLANEDFSRLTVSFRIYDNDRGKYLYEDAQRKLMASIREDIDAILDPETSPELWGISLRYLSLSEIVDRNQQVSMLVAISLILVATSLSFRSVLYGLFSLIPLTFGIMMNFIFMVTAGIPLDITTVLVTSVTIGVGVDNSIHFLLQFRKQRRALPDHRASVFANTLRITGRPILLTTASIVGGLLVLTLASFRPIIYFGLLVAVSLLSTAVGTLIILPAFLTIGSAEEKRAGRTA